MGGHHRQKYSNVERNRVRRHQWLDLFLSCYFVCCLCKPFHKRQPGRLYLGCIIAKSFIPFWNTPVNHSSLLYPFRHCCIFGGDGRPYQTCLAPRSIGKRSTSLLRDVSCGSFFFLHSNVVWNYWNFNFGFCCCCSFSKGEERVPLNSCWKPVLHQLTKSRLGMRYEGNILKMTCHSAPKK